MAPFLAANFVDDVGPTTTMKQGLSLKKKRMDWWKSINHCGRGKCIDTERRSYHDPTRLNEQSTIDPGRFLVQFWSGNAYIF